MHEEQHAVSDAGVSGCVVLKAVGKKREAYSSPTVPRSSTPQLLHPPSHPCQCETRAKRMATKREVPEEQLARFMTLEVCRVAARAMHVWRLGTGRGGEAWVWGNGLGVGHWLWGRSILEKGRRFSLYAAIPMAPPSCDFSFSSSPTSCRPLFFIRSLSSPSHSTAARPSMSMV